MKTDIIINGTTSETRIALLEDDQLVELFVERPENERMVGSLFKGVVRKVMGGMSAAFVDIGQAQDCFLHFSDVGGGNHAVQESARGGLTEDVDGYDEHARRIDAASMKPGTEVVVQVIKEPIGHKGPRVSSQLTIAGRFLVLLPHESFIGVSRKIENFKERKRLKAIVNQIRPKGFGLIVRTVADGKSLEELTADLDRALQSWRKMEKEIRKLKGPGIVYRDMSMASSVLRDLFTPDVNSVVVDLPKLHAELEGYIADVSPNLAHKVILHKERTPIFDHYNIEQDIEKCLSRKIWLSGGGYLFFDATEALVAIDVNSGRYASKSNHEENALKVNLQAVKEIARQLRLRDVGGIIVIDFIDLLDPKNRKKVFDEMVKAMQPDRSKWDIAPISPFGLLEMTRQRVRPSLLFTFREPCPLCDSTGLVPSMETVVTNLERWIKRFTAATGERRLTFQINPKVKQYLTDGGLQSRIIKIMWINRILITIEEDEALGIEDFRGISYRQNRDVTSDYLTEGYTKQLKKQAQ